MSTQRRFLTTSLAVLTALTALAGCSRVDRGDETAAGAFTGHGVAFTRAARYVLVVVGSSSSGPTPDDARRLAVAQAARL